MLAKHDIDFRLKLSPKPYKFAGCIDIKFFYIFLKY